VTGKNLTLVEPIVTLWPDFNLNYFKLRYIGILFLTTLNHYGGKSLGVDRRIAEAHHHKGDTADVIEGVRA
jgi:predicted secreted protein